jgi:tRNA threonylcarbamoyladenosine biosynthesis protein TsaE
MALADERIAVVERVLEDDAATRRLGAELAARADDGMLLLLHGPLGAGKTTLAQGFAAALGTDAAASPSFVIAHLYAGGKMPLWHLDLYRIEDRSSIEELDLEQYMPSGGATIVEWADRYDGPWPVDRIDVDIAIDGGRRRARISGRGRFASAVERLGAA